MARRLGFALIGLGRHARTTHFPNMMCHPQIDLKYVVEQDTNMARQFLKQYYREDIKVVSSSSDINNILEDESVDATVISTPVNTHEEYVKASVQAGKAVLCEKPLTTELSSINSCYNEANKYGRPLLCGFNRRFDPSISSLHQRVNEGEVGHIKCIRTFIRDHHVQPVEYLKTSGGIFVDCIIHEFDLIGWFMGLAPTTVYAQGHAWNKGVQEIDDIDYANVTMKFPNGTVVNIDCGRGTAYGEDHRIEIHGTNGVCLKRDTVYPTSLTSKGKAGELRDNSHGNCMGLWKESFQHELQHFINVLQGKEEVLVTAAECTRTAEITAACNESYKTGLPVHLPTSKIEDEEGSARYKRIAGNQ